MGEIHGGCQIQHNFKFVEYLFILVLNIYLFIFNLTEILVLYIFLEKMETFDISHAFLPLTAAKLSTLKDSSFFGQPCSFRDHSINSV